MKKNDMMAFIGLVLIMLSIAGLYQLIQTSNWTAGEFAMAGVLMLVLGGIVNQIKWEK